MRMSTPLEEPEPDVEPSPEPAPQNALTNLRRIVMSHETVISVLTILLVSCLLAGALIAYIQTVQIDGLSATSNTARESQLNVQRNLVNLQNRVEDIDQRVTNLETASVVPTSTPATATSTSASNATSTGRLPVAMQKSVAAPTSPSGALVRGSFSPDGTRYAGYDVVTVGKKGVAIEAVGTPSVSLVVPFNPKTQSSGLGLPQESSMSVRWLDNSTIEYDVIYKNADGTKTQKVETLKVSL